MTKKYKINGKEINEIEPIEERVKKTYSLQQGPMHLQNFELDKLIKTINQLLEALSDKEEECDCGSGLSSKVCRNNTSEPKQEEWEPCTCPKGSIDCDKCDGVEWVKQSTSLKEEINGLLKVKMVLMDDTEKYIPLENSNEVSEKILSLIQYHLVKEVEQVEPTQYVKKDSELNQTYTQAKLDIIKIINAL